MIYIIYLYEEKKKEEEEGWEVEILIGALAGTLAAGSHSCRWMTPTTIAIW